MALLAADLAAGLTVAGDVAGWDVPRRLGLHGEEEGRDDGKGEGLHVGSRGCQVDGGLGTGFDVGVLGLRIDL